ncbi:MAG TPA: ABC transporter permease [Candidatus Aenigmarchaeota archaeon]|nr:ABC transporter permease [Candidatus Aenigmarchaeota archaeon]
MQNNWLVIFKKTLKDYLNVKYLLVYIAITMLPPLIFSMSAEEAKLFKNLSLELRVEYLLGFFLLFAFTWVCGIAITMFSVFICSGFVADEVSNRTLIMVVAKPIRRTTLIISKFLAFVIIALCFEIVSILSTIYILASFFDLDVSSLFRFIELLPMLMIYSILVILTYGSLSTAFSTMFSSKMKALIPTITLIILSFFAFVPLRSVARTTGIYEKYYLDVLDVGYDLGNIYTGLLKKFNIKLIPPMQAIIGSFTGTYKIPRDGVKVDYDHGFILPELDEVKYHSFKHSFLKFMGLPLLFLAIGLLIFNRRDVH